MSSTGSQAQAQTQSQSQSQGSHSLAFRVMRLCKPSFHVDPPLRLDLSDLIAGEDIFDDPVAASNLTPLLDRHVANPTDSSDLSYRTRFLLHDSSDPMGLSSLLVLPQSFGAIYLGETFCSYISINNSSNFEVKDVIIKAEIQTERQRLLLLDTSKSPVESIRAGGRYDFIVEHDVKELGPHTLVCTALYNDGENERKYLPQFFKFMVANPLSVRTKVQIKPFQYDNNAMLIPGALVASWFELSRLIYVQTNWGKWHQLHQVTVWHSNLVTFETTYLEACIENHTKSNLFMDQVDFEPAQHWSATILQANEHHSHSNSQTRDTFKPPILIRSGGGIHNYLYQLKLSSHGSTQMKVEGSNILGKLQITWRTNLGEPGRLQTQQILGTPITHRDIELHVLEVPSVINLERSFSLHLKLTNQTDRELGPFEVLLLYDGLHEEKVVMINGLQTMALPQVAAFSFTDFHLDLIATKLGIQRITGITVYDTREKKSYNPLPDLEIFVDLD